MRENNSEYRHFPRSAKLYGGNVLKNKNEYPYYLWFSGDFRGNRKQLISLSLLNIRSEI